MGKGRNVIKESEARTDRLLVMQDLIRQPAQARGELSEWVMSLTLSGNVDYRIGDDRFTGRAGDLMVIRPLAKQHWQVHQAPDGSRGHWHVVYAIFYPSPEMMAWLDFSMTDAGYFLTNVRESPGVERRVAGAMRRARKLSTGQGPMGRELTHLALSEALLWVRAGLEKAGGTGPGMDVRVKRALGYMNNKLHEPITLEEIVKVSMASRSQLSLVFQQQMGVPVMKYLERLKMERAGQMLRMTTHPIKQIARAVGYEDPKYFVKRFRGVMGATPRGFRKISGEKSGGE